jgi:hypothetical protein
MSEGTENVAGSGKSTAMTTGTTVLKVPQHWFAELDESAAVTTYDLASVAGQRACFRSLNDEADKAENYINKVLLIEHVTFHPVRLKNDGIEEGPIKVRTVIVSPQGKMVSFVSDSVVRFFSRLTAFGKPGPWHPPLKVLLKRRQLDVDSAPYILQEVD